ncbi:MAG TPA: phosphodiester glycosidase family protein [Thermoanaerobaculia bacterium]
MKHAAFLLTILLAGAACAADWEQVSPGVDYQHITRGTIDVHITRIDLRNPAIRVIATDESQSGLTVTEYAKKTDAIVAINADYFDTAARPLGVAAGPCGAWWKGDPKLERRQGLVAVGKGRAEIQNREMVVRRWMNGAVSGWPALIAGCEPIADLPGSDHFTRAPHPRTAAGLSRDGKTMYFVVADGRREGVPGMTLPELAAFMDSELDACAAMNLDGGGSSAMWVRDRIVNRPSDGVERKVGNHLAVVAAGDYDGCIQHERLAKD